MKDKFSSYTESIFAVVVVLIALYLIVTTLDQCRDSSIKARAYDKVRYEGMSPDEALEESEYEQDMEDAAAADDYHY